MVTWKWPKQITSLPLFALPQGNSMAKLRRKPMLTYLYNRLGIQAEVEITEDKVGNFFKSLVNDSGRRNGDSSHWCCNADQPDRAWDSYATTLPNASCHKETTIVSCILKPSKKATISTLKPNSHQLFLAGQEDVEISSTNRTRYSVRSAFRRSRRKWWRACPREQVCDICMWDPMATAGPCLTCPQLPFLYIMSSLSAAVATTHSHVSKSHSGESL